MEREELWLASPGNKSLDLVPKFEILSILYSIVCMYLSAKTLSLLKL